MIIDAPFNAIPLPVRAALRRDGVELREYHPFRLLKPGWWGRRMHDKLLIVDGVHLVTGGRNLEASYFGLNDEEGCDTRADYVDRDAYVQGDAARGSQAYFDQVWTSEEVRRVKLAASAQARWRRIARKAPLPRAHRAPSAGSPGARLLDDR